MPELDLALHTGVRRSNLYGTRGSKRRMMEPLQWTAVNLDWKVLQLPRSKGGRGYAVPLNQTAMDALAILRERSDGPGAVIRKPKRPGNLLLPEMVRGVRQESRHSRPVLARPTAHIRNTTAKEPGTA
jgi:hypothetical protein